MIVVIMKALAIGLVVAVGASATLIALSRPSR